MYRRSKSEPEPEDQVAGEGDDELAKQLLAAFAKRSSRKVLAARLAAERGQKDLGDVLDAMATDETASDDALLAAFEGRFGLNVERRELAELLVRELGTGGEGEGEGEPSD